jgi:tRNA pseudouridine55 synthase
MATNRVKKGRLISGILVIDKPPGMSSNRVLQKVKHIYGAAKAGHTGALDPIATGVLPICLGGATKFSQGLLDSDKRYTTRVQLGESRDTADIDGAVVERCEIPSFDADQIEVVLSSLRGVITQIPPMYSALKVDGRKLYELARKGVEYDITKKARDITIHDLTLVDFGPDWLELDVTCSKGTYIRSLAEDVAKGLGTLGYVAVLRRLGAGPYGEDMMISLDDLEALRLPEEGPKDYRVLDNLLLASYTALPGMPILYVDMEQANDLTYGRPITLSPQNLSDNGLNEAGEQPLAQVQLRVRDFPPNAKYDYLLGLAELKTGGLVKPHRLLQVNGMPDL